MVTVLAPLGYLGFLFGSLYLFSKVYRKRQQSHTKREPWFGPHHSRDLYISLLSMEPAPARPVLVAALIRRAMADVQRIMEIRNAKMALQTLLQKGQIGDDTWQHLLETEKELEAEILEVVQEANTFRPGWGQIIFAHAGDMVQHEKNQHVFMDIEKEREKARARYNTPSRGIKPAPILGIAAANPKRRQLPVELPNANAQGPASKPPTPLPPSSSGANTPARQLQNQNTPNRSQLNTPSKAKTPARGGSPAKAGTTPVQQPLLERLASESKPASQSSSPEAPRSAPPMNRSETATTSATLDGSSDDGDASANEGSVLSNGTNKENASGNSSKKPKKTPKKKKGKKK